MYSQSWLKHFLEGICGNWISCHKGKILTIAFRSSNFFQASVKTPGVKRSRYSLSVVNSTLRKHLCSGCQVPPTFQRRLLCLSPKYNTEIFPSDLFPHRGDWNYKPKEMIQIFTILHKKILKIINKTSVWEKKSIEMWNLQQKCC